jgi:hypothetical protein
MTIANLAKMGEPDRAMTSFNSWMTNQRAGSTGIGHMIVGEDADGNPVYFNQPTDKAGNNKGPAQTTNVTVAARPNAKAESIRKEMGGEFNPDGSPKWVPGSPSYDREYGRRYAGVMMTPEHGSLRSVSDLRSSAAVTPQGNAPVPQPQQGREPGEIAYAPSKMSGTDMEKGAATLTAITGFRSLADDIDKLAPDVKAKARLWILKSLQENQILAFNQFLTPQEAATVSNLGHLQIRYQQAMGGLRGSGSPENYKVYYALMGNAAAGQETTQLRAIADQLETQYANENKMRATNRVRQGPPVSEAASPPPASSYTDRTKGDTGGWKDLGNGVRVRVK